jgi:hypothetical protein
MNNRRSAQGPITGLQEMVAALRQLLRKRLGHRHDARRSYRMRELWSTDSPPNDLEYTPWQIGSIALLDLQSPNRSFGWQMRWMSSKNGHSTRAISCGWNR